MSHGLPDFYRGVDIAYQALAEMIVRPKYGAAQRTSGFVGVLAGETKTLFTVSGKGIIYGGIIYYYPSTSQSMAIIWYYVDGNLIVDELPRTLNEFNVTQPLCFPLTKLLYDDINFDYCVGLSYGYTFEQSFSIQYEENNGGAVGVYYRAIFALI